MYDMLMQCRVEPGSDSGRHQRCSAAVAESKPENHP
jgi:hypothetical protein